MKNKNSKIYIAGHKGLVGSSLKRSLEFKGYSNLVFQCPSELNLKRQLEVEWFFERERPEYVFIAAARVGGILANKTYPAEFIYDNLMIQSNIIHTAFKYKVKKLLFLGSSCIYPKNSEQPIREEYLLSDLLEPTNEAYAIAKISGLKMCKFYNQQYGTNFISVMPTNLYGPNDNYDLETSHVLPALIRKIYLAKCFEDRNFHLIKQDFIRWEQFRDLKEDLSSPNMTEILKNLGIENSSGQNNSSVKVNLWGSGKPKREFLYVDDLAEICIKLMQKCDAKELGDYINIGCGLDISITDLAMIIKKEVGFKGLLDWDNSKPDGTLRKLLNIEKQMKLGWEPLISLEDGIKKTVKAYLSH